MKKLITTSILAIVMMTGTNAQITNPKISVNTTKVDNGIALKELKVNNLKEFKTLADFKKLNIPVQQATTEIFNKKPTQTWKISAAQLNNAQLKLDYFRGFLSNYEFSMQGSKHIDDEPGLIESARTSGILRADLASNFPLGIKFRASGGVEYVLKITELGDGYSGDIFILRNDTNISRITRTNQGDYYYVFKLEKSEDLTLKFSSIISHSRRGEDSWVRFKFKEIIINRISN